MVYDEASRGAPVDEEFSIGFISALVSEELIPCEVKLETGGWSRSTDQQSKALAQYGITKWKKSIERASVIAFSMAIGEMGQVSAAVETFAFLTRCKSNLIFLTGIAGSLHTDKVKKCDVVIANSVTFRTQDKVSGVRPNHHYRPRDHKLNGFSPDFSRRLQRFSADKYPSRNRANDDDHSNWNVHCSGLYTWDYVLSSPDIVNKLNTEYSRAACVEMEGGGFLTAIERFSQLHGQRQMRGFVVKGISDYAANKDSQLSVRSMASGNSAQVAVALAEWMVRKDNISMLGM